MTSPDPQYQLTLATTLWDYRNQAFGDRPELFDQPQRTGDRPPVFNRDAADHNLILPPDAGPTVTAAIRSAIPSSGRHRWFRSMKSSQAIAQSVFAGLEAAGELEALGGLRDDDGATIFHASGPGKLRLEKNITYLGEPRPTSVDAWFDGPSRIAIECKLIEQDIGTCSRPRLRPDDSSYEQQYCDGTYTHQRNRPERCSLTHIGVTYWEHIPQLFKWDPSVDLSPCPLAPTYQLIRNIVAATVTDEGVTDPDGGLAVLVYDARNPANAESGPVGAAYSMAKQALRYPELLRRCSWQRLTAHLRSEAAAPWLTAALGAKYGLE